MRFFSQFVLAALGHDPVSANVAADCWSVGIPALIPRSLPSIPINLMDKLNTNRAQEKASGSAPDARIPRIRPELIVQQTLAFRQHAVRHRNGHNQKEESGE